MWFFPDTQGDKLKYSQKEYLQLLEAVRPVLKTLGVKAVDLEKVSYVLGHLEQLEEPDRKKIENTFKGNERTVPKELNQTPETKITPPKSMKASRTTKAPGTKGTKRGSAAEPKDEKEQPSKRGLKRTRR